MILRRTPVAVLLVGMLALAACATPACRPSENRRIRFFPRSRPISSSPLREMWSRWPRPCAARKPPIRTCDFAILVDRDPRVGANAFQTIDRSGRPIIILTLGLVAILESQDELAFVLGHEAGHHIARHIPQQQQSAAEGARVFGEIAMAGGGNARDVARAAELGAAVGARSYSRSAELEADAIGTLIAFRAGYDPVAGAQLFTRLPEPELRFLSTHPPNAERMRVVRRTLAALRGGG